LHGDYRYDLLKNTDSELQRQEASLCTELVNVVKENPCIVSGYSGRDASIMQALQEAYAQPGNGTLYWCGYGNGGMTQGISELLEAAIKAGRDAYYVSSNGFDDLLVRLALYCCDNTRRR
jgi:hypothetical protein